MSVFENKTLMITGGTGSFGHTVLRHFLTSDISEIRIFPATRRSRMICVVSCKRNTRITSQR